MNYLNKEFLHEKHLCLIAEAMSLGELESGRSLNLELSLI